MTERQAELTTNRWSTLKRHFSNAFSGGAIQSRRSIDVASSSHAEERRRHAYRYILIALAVVLTPVDLHQFYLGHFLPAAVGFILLGVVFANIWQLGRAREALFSPTVILAMTLTVLLVSIYHGQTYTLYWVFPLLSLLPLVLEIRSALWLGLVSGILLLPILFLSFDTNTAIIICLSMTLTWVISAWLIYAVSVQSRRLRSMAETDPLTGAYNRRFFQLQAQMAFEQWQRNKRPASVLLVDVDHFKRVNDRRGHAAGDLALKNLVDLITSRVRKVDTLCRYGGEEFAVLLPETDAKGAVFVAEEIRAKVESSRLIESDTITISIGVCELVGVEDTDQWINLADAALYRAKKSGRNRVELATTTDATVQVASLEKELPEWR
ncbi:MAG: GGDEF domain-containing protein [Proteobacteria bacterium]|nr:GGDEF domain-containing protein [Pseudomonadota bacterium]